MDKLKISFFVESFIMYSKILSNPFTINASEFVYVLYLLLFFLTYTHASEVQPGILYKSDL